MSALGTFIFRSVFAALSAGFSGLTAFLIVAHGLPVQTGMSTALAVWFGYLVFIFPRPTP